MSPLDRAVECFGSQRALADAAGVSSQTVSMWITGARSVGPEAAVVIEQITDGAVRRWDLRPDKWHLIWPELIGADGAPAVPVDTREVA